MLRLNQIRSRLLSISFRSKEKEQKEETIQNRTDRSQILKSRSLSLQMQQTENKREVGENRNTNTTRAPFVENLISAKITTPIPFFELFQTKSTRSTMKRRSGRDHHRAAGEEFSEHRRHCRCSPTTLAEEPKP